MIHITDKSKSGFTLKMHGYGEGGQHRAKKQQHTTRVLSSVQAIYTTVHALDHSVMDK